MWHNQQDICHLKDAQYKSLTLKSAHLFVLHCLLEDIELGQSQQYMINSNTPFINLQILAKRFARNKHIISNI